MAKYTKAPWKYDNDLGCKSIKGAKHGTHRQGQYEQIAFTTGLSDDEEDEANARLMTAAPRLLEACKEAIDILKPKMVSTPVPERVKKAMVILEAAIAAAEGSDG